MALDLRTMGTGLWMRLASLGTWVRDTVTLKKKPALKAHAGADTVWRPFHKAPKGFRNAAIAASKAMAQDDEIPVGVSFHEINGVAVEVHKPARGHLAVTRYASEG